MAKGKRTCKILKEIRRQIAAANDIELVVEECRYKGDCSGTCPRCEAEVRYLEEQLQARRLSGRAVAIAGISAGMLLMASASGYANLKEVDEPQNTERATIFGMTDPMAQFPGGDAALMQFIKEHLVYPEQAAKDSIQGRVVLKFLVRADGTIGDIVIIRSIHELVDAEAIRVVKLLPKFIPGELNGKPVDMWFTIPVNFKLKK